MILRELFAKLGLDVDAQSFAKGQIAVELVKKGVEKLVDAAKEMVSSFVENVKATAEYAETIDKLGQSSGLGAASLQRLGKAAASEGIGVEDFAHSMVFLSKSMIEASKGGEGAAAVYGSLGVKVKDAHGKIRPTEDVFIDLADALSKMDDGAKKVSISTQLLGRSGTELIPVLNKGREELEKYMSAQVMNEDQIRAGKEVVQVQRQLVAQTKSLWRSAVGPLLPAIRDLLRSFLEWKKANNELLKTKIQAFLGGVIKAIEILGRAFEATVSALKFFKGVLGDVISALTSGNTALTAIFVGIGIVAVAAARKTILAWIAAAAPFVALGAVIAGILLFFDDINSYQKSIERGGTGSKTIYGRFKKEIDGWLKPAATDPWWLKAIKDLVELLQKAVELSRELGLSGESQRARADKSAARSPADIQAEVTANTFKAARASAAQGLPLTPAQTAVLKKQGIPEEAFRQKYGPGSQPEQWAPPSFTAPEPIAPAAPAVGSRTVYAPSQTNHIVIHALPGMSTEDVGAIAEEKISQHWEGQMEKSAAAGGG